MLFSLVLLITDSPFRILCYSPDWALLACAANKNHLRELDNLSTLIITKELIVDFRKTEAKTHNSVYIGGAEVEQVDSFLGGINIIENLSSTFWGNTRRLNVRAKPNNFCRGATENILTGNITIWHGSPTAQDRTALQWMIKTSKNITGNHLPSISDIRLWEF